MSYGKHGLKALGLSFLAVLGLMAFGAAGAQGSGKVLVSGLTPPFTVGVTGEDDSPTDDRFWILNLNLEIVCHKSSILSGLLSSTGHGSGTFLLEECLAQGTNAVGSLIGAACSPSPTTIEGKALALIILHSGGPYVLFTPLDGLTFSTVKNSNEECLLPELTTVKGCYVGKLTTTGDQVTHLISTAGMLTLFGCVMKYGNNVAHLETDGFAKLNNSVHGSHAGLKWGVE